MNTVGSTTVDIKKTLLHYIKAEFKEKDLDMLKSLLGSIYTELTNTPDILPHLESPNFAADPLDCCDRTNSDTITDTPSFSPDNLKPYQDFLIAAVSTVNSKLCSIHSFLTFLDRADCFVQLEKVQKKELKATYAILTPEDYHKLLEESSRPQKRKVNLMIRAFGQTGIRVSELQFITVESIQQQEITIRNKNKNRKVPLIRELQEMLNDYVIEKNIPSGPIFTDKNKKPLERQNIYNMLQTIAANAGIDKRKAHPHALRHFFAKSFYDKTHDLVMLSNILGHSDISTTKNYVTGTFEELCNEMEEIGIL